jgi:thermitase
MKAKILKGKATKNVSSFGILHCPKPLVLKHLSFLTMVIFLFFFVLAFVNAVSQSARAETGTEFVPGVIMIKFAESVKADLEKKEGYIATGIPSMDALNKKYGVKDFVKVFSPEPRSEKDKTGYKELGLGRIYKLEMNPETDVQAMVAEYKAVPNVEYAEPDFVGQGHFIPNDPNFVTRQWGLYNTGLNPPEHPGTVDADIDATEAWPWWTPEHVIVLAILDTGVDIDHPDFWWTYPTHGVIWNNTAECSGIAGVDDDGNGYVDDCWGVDFVNGTYSGGVWYNDADGPQDDQGHGTVNAGIAGAITNNNAGVAGLAGGPFNPQLIMSVKVINSANLFQYSNLIAGIYYAANNGARVINMSMGGLSYSSTLEAAVNYAWNTKGCVLVASMGNCNSSTPQYPAALTNTIAVGATDTDDSRCVPPDWDFMGTDAICGSVHGSNYGSHIDVVAPGNWIYSTVWNNTYAYWAGTSQAAPFVSGLAAMLMCQTWPEPSPDSIRHIIQSTADDTVGLPGEDTPGWDQYYGWGRINAKRALNVPTPMYAEDFNDSNITDWTVYTSSGTFATTTSQWVSPSCGLHMVSQSGGYAYGTTPTVCLDTTQDFTITTYFRLPNTNNHWFWVLSNGWVELVIDYGPELSAYQGLQGPTLLIDSLNTNQWYHIKVVVHPATSNYDVYLNCYYVTTAKFPGNYVRYLRLGDFENGGSNFGEGYWDDLAVYGKKFLRGDVNADGKINTSDIVYLINYLFISGPAPVPLRAGDVNADGLINASDVVYLTNYLFIGGPPPPC